MAAIVVNWNGALQLTACLDALVAQDHDDLEIWVVDNASTDGSRDLLERYAAERTAIAAMRPGQPPIRVLWNETNRGYAGAVNDALARIDATAVAVSNFDVQPRHDYVSTALGALLADDRRGAVQGKLLRPGRGADGSDVIDTTGHVAFRTRLFRNRGEGQADAGQWDEPGEVFGVSGALALYRRAMLDDVAVDIDGRSEILDEDLFAFFEDIDLDWRARMRGWVAWYEPRAVAEHERGGSGPRRTAHVEQLNFQNRLLTLIKCDSPSRLVRHLPGVVVTTVLKAGELLLTVPRAFFATFGAVRLVLRTLRKRRLVHAGATVPSRQVVDRWFDPFDYGDWMRSWWRRVRAERHRSRR
ncbi:MAG: glycosyltransferase [Actinobacteria bacterium]|nr:glycosyltransferase [Actinomycetota bacterium]